MLRERGEKVDGVAHRSGEAGEECLNGVVKGITMADDSGQACVFENLDWVDSLTVP